LLTAKLHSHYEVGVGNFCEVRSWTFYLRLRNPGRKDAGVMKPGSVSVPVVKNRY